MALCHHYELSGELKVAEDNWCSTCLKPSMLQGIWYLLCPEGIDELGVVRGCGECATWTVHLLDGTIKTLEGNAE